MVVSIYNPQIVWEPGDERVAAALDAELRAWDRTPYESGQRFKGRGADCIGGVFGVIDALDGRERAQFPGMPHDASLHDRAGAVRAMRELVRRYQPCHRLATRNGMCVQPGDIVGVGPPGGGPGHVLIVGARRNELWQALPLSGFHQSGWSLFAEQVLWAVYRIEDRERWTA